MIEVRCLHDFADAEPHGAAMAALNLAAMHPDPFSSPAYLERCFAGLLTGDAPPQLRLLLMFRGELLIGYAALKRTQARVLGCRAAKLDWLTDHAAPSPQVVCGAEERGAVCAALCAYLLQRKSDWSLLELQQQPTDGVLARELNRQIGSSHRLCQWPNLTRWSVPIGGHDLASYHAALAPHFRSNLSRQMRKLFASGVVSTLEGNGASVLPELLTHYREIVPASWRARSAAARPRVPEDRSALPAAAVAMPVTVQLLLLDGVPVAGLVSGDHAGATYALEMVYDERHAALAPGLAMMFFGLQRAMRIGMERFELLRGYGYYKQRWLAVPTPTESLQVYRRGSPWDWHRALGDLLRRGQPRPPSPPADHNPLRRTAASAAKERIVPRLALSDAQLFEWQSRAGVRWQSGVELAAALPFPLGPQKARPPVRHRRSPAASAEAHP